MNDPLNIESNSAQPASEHLITHPDGASVLEEGAFIANHLVITDLSKRWETALRAQEKIQNLEDCKICATAVSLLLALSLLSDGYKPLSMFHRIELSYMIETLAEEQAPSYPLSRGAANLAVVPIALWINSLSSEKPYE